MSREELYQWAIDRAQDALAGAERKVEKLRGHLGDAEIWLEEATAKAAELEKLGLDGFLASLDGDAPAPAPAADEAPGAAGAAAHNASVKTS